MRQYLSGKETKGNKRIKWLEPKRIERLFHVNIDPLLHDTFTIKVSELAKKTKTMKRSL